MFFKQIFEPKLAQYAYLLGCEETGEALIVDPQRDIQRYLDIAGEDNLRITAAAETHIHADYLSGLREFAEHGARIYASDEGGADWKYEWLIGSQYDYVLLKDGDEFSLGELRISVRHTPGHTPEHLIYTIAVGKKDSARAAEILTGDFVFVGDVGRPDLLETAAGVVGSMEIGAKQMFDSLQDFKTLPEDWKIWPGHGAGSACGKALGATPSSTVADELRTNAALRASNDLREFKAYILADQPEPPLYFARMKRDNRLGPPVLGKLPTPRLLSFDELQELSVKPEHVVLDTRSWDEFQEGHLRGALFTPLNNEFTTVAGSYVTENDSIYLLVAKERLTEVVTDLIRIGLDNIVGYCTPDAFERAEVSGASLETTRQITVNEYERLRKTDGAFALDVRRAEELKNVGSIPGVYNISHTRLLERISELPSEKTILVSCRSGVRSSYACALLERQGFVAVNVVGGYLSWLEREPTQIAVSTDEKN